MYTFTYSDGYDIPDIHGWNYYLMDDFLFPFLWMRLRDAQMRQPGSQVVAYWLEAKCLLHLSIGMCYDLWMHVSALIGPDKFHKAIVNERVFDTVS